MARKSKNVSVSLKSDKDIRVTRAVHEVYKLEFNKKEYLLSEILNILESQKDKFSNLIYVAKKYPMSKIVVNKGYPYLYVVYNDKVVNKGRVKNG